MAYRWELGFPCLFIFLYHFVILEWGGVALTYIDILVLVFLCVALAVVGTLALFMSFNSSSNVTVEVSEPIAFEDTGLRFCKCE